MKLIISAVLSRPIYDFNSYNITRIPTWYEYLKIDSLSIVLRFLSRFGRKMFTIGYTNIIIYNFTYSHA